MMASPSNVEPVHNSYFVLEKVSGRLHDNLAGGTVTTCFSQESEVLVVGFHNKKEASFIQADVAAGFSCLSFPKQFHRARRNSIDLFPEFIGRTVTTVTQHRNERSFSVDTTDGLSLLIKMHGNRANVILLRDGRPTALFKNSLKADWTLNAAALGQNLDWSRETFLRSNDPRKYYVPLPAALWRHLESIGWNVLSPDERWTLFNQYVRQLNSGKFFLVYEPPIAPVFTLLPSKDAQPLSADVLEALTDFYKISLAHRKAASQRKVVLTRLDQKLKSLQRGTDEARHRLHELTEDDPYTRWADLIMANLNNIQKGSTQVSVADFADGKPVSIPLQAALNPQHNAERYYRKSKNRTKEKERITGTLAVRESEIARLTTFRDSVAAAHSPEEVGEIASKFEPSGKQTEQKALPFHEHLYKKYKIWVGRNAAANDTLTLKLTSPNDEWLHARDCAGSHVVIKSQSGKVTPRDVIERAAELAGWNSKRKNETLCPVIVTKKKYVRKRKGSAPGEVVVEREKVIFVSPRG